MIANQPNDCTTPPSCEPRARTGVTPRTGGAGATVSGPEIEKTVKKVLDQPHHKQNVVYAREAHENIEKQNYVNTKLREQIEQQEKALTEMHESIGKFKAQMFTKVSEIDSKVKTDLEKMTTRINYCFQEIDSFKLRYDG